MYKRRDMNMAKRKTKWVKKRHIIVRNLLYLPLYIYTTLKYGIKIEKFCGDDNRPYLILFNHQTTFDQFFISLSFPKHVYFVASEDLFSNGFVSKLITWLVAPIPFKKSTSDITGVKNCLRVSREGGSIGMAPEGNRTYSGTTEYIKPAVASLAKALKMPVALYRIEGGYGVQPRWSDKVRKGKMKVYCSKIIEPETLEKLSNEELFDVIYNELYVDERLDKSHFYSKNNAEFLDRVFYYCPYCNFSEFYSVKDIILCKTCERKIRYLPDKTLKGIDFNFPFDNTKDWYDAQTEYMINLKTDGYKDKAIFKDNICFINNFYCDKKIILDKDAALFAYSDRFVIDTAEKSYTFMYSELSAATVLGRNKMNIYLDKQIFQFKGNKHFNALKYLQLYSKIALEERGEPCGKYLGL